MYMYVCMRSFSWLVIGKCYGCTAGNMVIPKSGFVCPTIGTFGERFFYGNGQGFQHFRSWDPSGDDIRGGRDRFRLVGRTRTNETGLLRSWFGPAMPTTHMWPSGKRGDGWGLPSPLLGFACLALLANLDRLKIRGGRDQIQLLPLRLSRLLVWVGPHSEREGGASYSTSTWWPVNSNLLDRFCITGL